MDKPVDNPRDIENFQPGTSNVTYWVGHPSRELIAADQSLVDELLAAGEKVEEWFKPHQPDDVIKLRGPQHMIDRALVPWVIR